MAYVRGNGLGADTPAAIDPRDRVASLVQSDEHRARFAYAFRSARYLAPTQQQRLLQSLEAQVAALPPSRRQQAAVLATQSVTLDPRASVGLGGPEGAISTVAQIASLVATLGTLGLTTVTFLDQQKQKKAAAAAEKKQTDAQTALVNQQIAAQQQAMAEEKARFDAEMAALRPTGADSQAPKLVVGPDGKLQPAPSNTTPLLLGSGIAAAAAFFLK